MSAFSTSSHVPSDKEGKKLDRLYTAKATFTLIFRDFVKLGETISMLFRMPHVDVGNTAWRLTSATTKSLGSESRKAAMEDAIRKAKDYAEVFGRVAVPIEVKDSGSRGYSQELGRTRSESSKNQIDGLILEPEDVSVSSEIDVKLQAD